MEYEWKEGGWRGRGPAPGDRGWEEGHRELLALLAQWHKGEGKKFPEIPCALGPQFGQGVSRVELAGPPGLPL